MNAQSLILLALVLAVSGCESPPSRIVPRTPIAPGPSAPAAPPPAPTPAAGLKVVSGADLTAVAGAIVYIDGVRYEIGADGQVIGLPTQFGGAVDVDAPGFLPRRTTWDTNVIVLWPIADDIEAAAIRKMVYQRGWPPDEKRFPSAPGAFYVTIYEADRMVAGQAIVPVWEETAKEFGAQFGLSYEMSRTFQYETNEIEVTFNAADTRCQAPPATGFCRTHDVYESFNVLPERASDRTTIRRVLASWFLGPNPLPGFLNAAAAASDLTPLEVQTIRMILRRPKVNYWPDSDR